MFGQQPYVSGDVVLGLVRELVPPSREFIGIDDFHHALEVYPKGTCPLIVYSPGALPTMSSTQCGEERTPTVTSAVTSWWVTSDDLSQPLHPDLAQRLLNPIAKERR